MGRSSNIRRVGRRLRGGPVLAVAVLAVAVLPGLASADDIVDTVDGSVDSNRENVTITAGGSTSVGFFVNANTGGGDAAGCNATSGSPAVVTISPPVEITATPSTLSFSSCGTTLSSSFSSTALGQTNVDNFSVAGGIAGSSWVTNTARFILNVNPRPVAALGATATGTSSIGLSWTASPDAASISSYEITRSPAFATTPQLAAAAAVSFGDSGLTPDTEYCYTVVALYNPGGGFRSETRTACARTRALDTTAPTIGYELDPPAPDGAAGWYVGDVTLTWTVTDPQSPYTTTGCVDQQITSDQANTTYSCSATSAGGSAGPVTVSIKRDATAPTISASLDPDSGGGWNTTNVAVTYVCDDELSGVASCGPDQTLSSEGDAVPYGGTAVDVAGNDASVTGSVKIDKSAPTISAVLSPDANVNGWHKGDVHVDYSCADTVSGVASCGPDDDLTGEGSAVGYSGTAVDVAGLSTTLSGTVKIDRTAPTISASLPAPNVAGWYKANVVVDYGCADALSGVASCGPDQTLSTEGDAVGYSGIAVDNAGNESGPASGTVRIDRTSPANAVTGVANGSTYVLGSVPSAGCSTTDGLSGVSTSASLSVSPGSVGSITATCSGGSDVAGNLATTASATYTVIYAWDGFRQPVDNLPALNVVKAGSAVPVKFSLGGNQGLAIMAAGFPTSKSVECGLTAAEDVVEVTVTAGSSSLSYDAAADQYNYVWKTDKLWAGTCRTLTVKLIDGTIHQANFRLTK